MKPSIAVCPYYPEYTHGAVGMHHCPECGEMVVAGMPHPDYVAAEEHLMQMASIRFGDLLILEDGQYALVVDPLEDGTSAVVELFQGNGLAVKVEWVQIKEVVTLPDSSAHVNFAEFMVTSRP